MAKAILEAEARKSFMNFVNGARLKSNKVRRLGAGGEGGKWMQS